MRLKSSWLLLLAWVAIACGEVPPLPEGELAPVAVRATRQQLPSTDKVLILDSSVSGGLSSREAQAVRNYSPTTQIDVLKPEDWLLLTAEQFMEYRTIIIGDAGCQSGEAAFQAAIDTRRLWGAIIDGDVVIVSTNPTSNITPRLVDNAIQVALDSVQFRTGMYISLGCAYQNAPPSTVVTLLEPFGHFKVEGVPDCGTAGHFFRMFPPTLSRSIADGQLPGAGGCVARSVFTSYPDHTFAFAALATGTPEEPIPGQRTYIDYLFEEDVETEFIGTPYVLVKGATAVSAGCGDQDHGGPPDEDCDFGDNGNGQPAPPGEDPGNTCSHSCHLHWCGDGAVDEEFGEECDQGANNGRSGDAEGRIGTCTGFCKIPDIGLPNQPPVAICKDVTVVATNTCGVPADINDGSYDPDGDLVGCVQNPPGPYLIGSTRVTLTCRDRAAQFGSCTGMVTVTDLIAPTVTLEGPASEVMECTQGATYPDQGASARDICEGPLPVTTSGSVDMGSPGSYSLTYSATDSSGNVGTATRAVAVNDTLPPTVTLSGSNPLQHECGVPFTDPGALGTDQCAGTLLPTTSGTVDNRVPGSYSLRYSVSDPTGHSAAQDRVVTVSDTLPPSITVREPLEDTLECGSPYVDPGATADDMCAGPLPVTTTQTGSADRPGTFTLSYSAIDLAGHEATSPVSRTVHVVDETPPMLTLVEPVTQVVECATPWSEPGAMASDACSGDLTSDIIRSGSVNEGTLGSYPLTYNVTDPAGHSATPRQRTVNVQDTLVPSITIRGPLSVQLQCDHVAYEDPGATAADSCAGDLTGAVQQVGSVDTGLPGSYTLRYRVADPSGNQATSAEARTVSVVDDQPPTLELLGSASMRVECGSPYDDPGAKARDACAGDLSERITRTGVVNPAMPASYTISYSVSDPASNRVTVLREVSVADTLPPSIVCPEPLVVETPEDTLATVSLRAATATDVCSQAQVSIPTQTEFPVGTTELTYTATDVAGNSAKCTTSVTVLAIAPPLPDLDRALIGGGNGCSSTGGGPSSLAMIGLGVLASLLARKRTRAILPVLAVLLLGSKAVAQPVGIPPFELERLMLNPSGRGSLLLGTGELLPHGEYRLSLTSHYENDPLLLVQNGTHLGTVVRHRATMHLAAAYGLWGWVELGAQIPVVLLQRGDDLTDRGIGIPRGSLAAGTPLFSAQLKLLSQREDDLVDLSLGVHAGPAVGSAAALAREFRGTPTVMVGRRFEHLQTAIDAGVMFRRRTILSPDANVQDEIGHALRLGATLSSLGEGLRGEVAVLGSVPLKREGSSVETLAGARYPVGEAFEVYGLAGLGFGTAAGTPDFRVLLGFAFERPRPPAQVEVAKYEPALPLPMDSDADGVLDDVDRCPTVPGLEGLQGCPDDDGDGVEDGVDRCLGEAGPVDRQGCPERDSDGDGLLDGKDSCPTVAGPLDRGGCPVPDRDHDTVEDLRDNCPETAGPPANQGCPEEEKQLVVIQKDRIEIKDKVHFDFNKATIQPRSYGLLDQVARVLVEHPEIVAVIIEGHTDGVGTAEYNRGLSQRRAEAVRDYFAQKGVTLERMQAQGFGEDRPVESNATSAGRAANRRVEFITRYEQEQP